MARSSAPFFDPYKSTMLPCVPQSAVPASSPRRQSIASPTHRRSRDSSKEAVRSSRNHSRTSAAKMESFDPLPPNFKTSEPTGDTRPTLPTPPPLPDSNNDELWERALKKVAEVGVQTKREGIQQWLIVCRSGRSTRTRLDIDSPLVMHELTTL